MKLSILPSITTSSLIRSVTAFGALFFSKSCNVFSLNSLSVIVSVGSIVMCLHVGSPFTTSKNLISCSFGGNTVRVSLFVIEEVSLVVLLSRRLYVVDGRLFVSVGGCCCVGGCTIFVAGCLDCFFS